MHEHPSTSPATPSPARPPLARLLPAALLLGVAAALGLASVTRAADPSQGLLDAAEETIAGATTEALADVAAPVVDVSVPVLEAAIEVVEPAIAVPIVEELEPAVAALPPVLESGPLAEALGPVVDGVAPIIDATQPLVRTVGPIVESIDGLAPLPGPLVPAPLGPTLPVFEAGASEAPDTGSASSAAVAIPRIPAGDVGAVEVVRVGAPPTIAAAFLPHLLSATYAADERAGPPVAVTGLTDATVLAVGGSSIGTAILLALLLYRPSSRRAWLPDALGPPASRTLTVLVPPG